MAITDTGTLTATVKALYNAAALQAFTESAQFFRSASIRPVELGEGGIGKGKSAVIDVWGATSVATTPLGETADGTPTTEAVTQVEVTLAEYGNHVVTSKKLRLTDYGEPEERAAWMMGQMASDTLDLLARAALDVQTGATWNTYPVGKSAVNTIVKTDELTAGLVRTAFAKLRKRKVAKIDGYYLAYVHPDVFKDLKDETGDGAFTTVAQYNNMSFAPINDEIGIYEGFRWILSSNCYVASKAGNGTTTSAASCDVYSTYFMGQEALGFAYNGDVPSINVSEPMIMPGDAFGRKQIVNWYGLCGFKALRDDSLQKVKTSSSLAANGA